MGKLIDTVSRGLNVRHQEVETIEKGLRVRAGGDWIEADHVILACPAWSAAALLGNVDPELARRLNEIPYSSSLTASLIYKDSEFDGKRAGFGFLVPQRERQRMAACTFVGTKFPYRAPRRPHRAALLFWRHGRRGGIERIGRIDDPDRA